MRHSRPRRSVMSRLSSDHLRREDTALAPPDLFTEPCDRPPSPLERVLRLVMATGAATAGVCLVLALVALMATAGSARLAGTHPGRQGASPSTVGPPTLLRAGRTVGFQSGSGQRLPFRFRIDQYGQWGLAWSFRCPAGQRGEFALTVGGRDRDEHDENVDTSGTAGHEIVWHAPDQGDHQVMIVSSCPWTVRVVLPRAPGSPQANPTGRGKTPPGSQPSPSHPGSPRPSTPHPTPSTTPHPHPSPHTPSPKPTRVSRMWAGRAYCA